MAYNTVLKMVPILGAAASDYQDKVLRNLPCKRLQVDEIWSFCHSKRHHVPPEKRGEINYGDLWTFVALDPETKLVPSWLVGKRDAQTSCEFMSDLASRLANRVQLTSDGYKPYLNAVDYAFGRKIDYGMLVKIYDNNKTDPETLKLHTDPGIKPYKMMGSPKAKHISTSIVERQNLTMRHGIRRMMRRTNGHSKKAINHAHATALHFLYYNFARIHMTLRMTPAMAAGVSDHVWSLAEIADLPNKFSIAEQLKAA